VPVANHSFEAPTVTYAQVASPFVDGWTTDGTSMMEYPPGSGMFVNLGTGIFPNTPAGEPDHIANVHGSQAAFLAAETGNEFTQALATPFSAGNSYALTVAVGRSYGQAPAETAQVRLGLYFLDDAAQRQFVTWTDVRNDAATGLSANHLVDFSATSAMLAGDHAAIGRPIHVYLGAIGPIGGFFDLDDVRVTEVPEPASAGMLLALIGLGVASRGRRVAKCGR
jgi:hypothetical protein